MDKGDDLEPAGARHSRLARDERASQLTLTAHPLRTDEEQAPKRERDGLSLARWNQEPYVSGANRV